MKNEERRVKALQEALSGLTEYFDTVQIFVTKHVDTNEEMTKALTIGAGNIFARIEQVKIWATKQEDGLLQIFSEETTPPQPPEEESNED
jgi:hypothetical protein